MAHQLVTPLHINGLLKLSTFILKKAINKIGDLLTSMFTSHLVDKQISQLSIYTCGSVKYLFHNTVVQLCLLHFQYSL